MPLPLMTRTVLHLQNSWSYFAGEFQDGYALSMPPAPLKLRPYGALEIRLLLLLLLLTLF